MSLSTSQGAATRWRDGVSALAMMSVWRNARQCEPVSDADDAAPDPLETHWSDSPNENAYNGMIAFDVPDRWGSYQPALPPLLFKSLICQESDFDPDSVSDSGYAGLTQISVEEAHQEGLKTRPHDERFVPNKNIHAGVGILQGKVDLMLHPEKLADDYPFAKKVVAAYAQYGPPTGVDVWTLGLAAYNGGQGTVMRAMANAFDRKLDPKNWSNVIEPKDHPEKSPLYAATLEVFGPRRALEKYDEISKYPMQILARAPQPAVGDFPENAEATLCELSAVSSQPSGNEPDS